MPTTRRESGVLLTKGDVGGVALAANQALFVVNLESLMGSSGRVGVGIGRDGPRVVGVFELDTITKSTALHHVVRVL